MHTSSIGYEKRILKENDVGVYIKRNVDGPTFHSEGSIDE